MSKQMITIIADEDIINELATYPANRCLWASIRHVVPDDVSELINKGNDNDINVKHFMVATMVNSTADILNEEESDDI